MVVELACVVVNSKFSAVAIFLLHSHYVLCRDLC